MSKAKSQSPDLEAQARKLVPEPTVGEILQKARKEQKVALKSIAQEINVRVGQLEALEEGRLDELPGMVYAIGYLRSYATYLGLDDEEMIARFKAEHGQKQPERPELHFPTPAAQSRIPDRRIVFGGVGIAVILLGIWLVSASRDRDVVETVAPLPDRLKTEEQVAAESVPLPGVVAGIVDRTMEDAQAMLAGVEEMPPPPAVAETPAPPAVQEPQKPVAPVAAKGKGRILIRARENTWVQIKDNVNKKTILRRVLKPDEQFYVPDRAGLEMVTANAGGLDVYVDGKKVQPLGKTGEILRDIDLVPEELAKKRVLMR